MLTITISTKAAVIAAATILFAIAALPFAISYAQDGEPEAVASIESRAPVSTEFQYQGRLELNGVPANGTHTLGFTLYSDAVANAPVGNPITAVLQVNNGLFSIALDFGGAAFSGDERWLGVEALVNGNFVQVGSRQPIRATPYALHSLTTGPHDHFGETWSGAADDGLLVENTDPTGRAIKGVGVAVGVTGEATLGAGVQGLGYGNSTRGVLAAAIGTGARGIQAEGYGDGGVGIYAYGDEWAGDFDGWLRVSQGIRADDVLPTYPGACKNGGCYVGDTVKPWTAMFAGAFNVQSDARKKQDITGLPYGLAEILALRPVSYSFIDDETGKTRLGLIAQEVERVMPEVVTPPASEDAFYAMSYDDLIPVLIKAIQEQQAEIELLKGALGID